MLLALLPLGLGLLFDKLLVLVVLPLVLLYVLQSHRLLFAQGGTRLHLLDLGHQMWLVSPSLTVLQAGENLVGLLVQLNPHYFPLLDLLNPPLDL
jgi:hypothetical protein